MLATLLTLAAEEAEPSKTAFYLAGGALALWAVAVTAVGMTRPGFATTAGPARGVMAVTAALVAAAIATSIITA